MPLSYAIIGTGAIGGYYGARLQQAGCEVHFLLRSDYEQVQDRGLTIESIHGDFTLPCVKAYAKPEDIPPVEVAIIALKTTDNPLLQNLLPKLKPDGVILSLQNGLGIEAEIVQLLEKINRETTKLTPNVSPSVSSSVLGGLCFICSNKLGAGHIQHLDYGRVLLGAHDQAQQLCPPTPVMQAIATDFTQAKIPITLTDDLPMARWKKLVWNVPYNGLSVVLDATTEEMMADEGVRSLITTLMHEVVTVANAWGQSVSPGSARSLPPETIDQMLSQTAQMPPYRTSMKIDYDERNPLELEAILGNPLRTAQTFNIPTPAMTMLYQQLIFLNSRNRL